MASEAIKRLILQEMFKQGAANRQKRQSQEQADLLAKQAPGLFGQQAVEGVEAQPAQAEVTSPYLMGQDETMPGEGQIPGLMNIDQQAQPAVEAVQAQPGTGMYNENLPEQSRFLMERNQTMLGSGVPSLQKQALSNMQQMQSAQLAASRGEKGVMRTVGVEGQPGMVQEVYVQNVNGNLVETPVGGPKLQRDPWQNLGTKMFNTITGESMSIENYIKAKDTAAGRAEVDQPNKVALEELKLKNALIKDQESAEMSLYKEQLVNSAKYKDTLKTANRISELGKKVETGQIAGSAPSVYLRTLFGDQDLQELTALLRGLPLPLLRATFGAAFTEMEGKTLSEAMANVKMDAPAFQAAMDKLKFKLVDDERVFQSKKKWKSSGKRLSDWNQQAGGVQNAVPNLTDNQPAIRNWGE